MIVSTALSGCFFFLPRVALLEPLPGAASMNSALFRPMRINHCDRPARVQAVLATCSASTVHRTLCCSRSRLADRENSTRPAARIANLFGRHAAIAAPRGVLDGLFAARMMAGQVVEEGGRETTRLQLKRLSHLDGLRFLAQLWILAAENLYIGWCVCLSKRQLHLWSAAIAQCFSSDASSS
jgi:hypothetical protein